MTRWHLMLVCGVGLGCAACATTPPSEVATPVLAPLPAPPPCPQAHYRVPIVTQVVVPDTIVGGVLIPQHPTYVVLQPGAWQVGDTETMRQPGTPAVPEGCVPLPGGR